MAEYDPLTATDGKPHPDYGVPRFDIQEMTLPPKPVGYYLWDGVDWAVQKRPNWFQRKMIRWFFGWGWRDAS